MDRALPMGCSISFAKFECFSSFLEWALKCWLGVSHIIYYLDDFSFAEMAAFRDLAREPDVPLAEQKNEDLDTYLVIKLGHIHQIYHLLEEKLNVKVRRVLAHHKVTDWALQELVGYLNFAC